TFRKGVNLCRGVNHLLKFIYCLATVIIGFQIVQCTKFFEHARYCLSCAYSLAELGTLMTTYTIAYGDDDVEVVIFYLAFLRFFTDCAMLSGMSEFPTYHVFFQFSFFKNMLDVLRNGRSTLLKKLCHLCLCQPYRLTLQPGLDTGNAVVALINNNVTLLLHNPESLKHRAIDH